MATTANGNGNLVDEFEEAFQSCLNVLTKEEALSTMEKDEIRVEVDHTILRFIDLARQMEAFFLQKRFLLSALKPELVVKEVATSLGFNICVAVSVEQCLALCTVNHGGYRQRQPCRVRLSSWFSTDESGSRQCECVDQCGHCVSREWTSESSVSTSEYSICVARARVVCMALGPVAGCRAWRLASLGILFGEDRPVALECQWLRVVGVPLAPWSLLSRPCSSSSRRQEVLAGLPSLHKALAGCCRDPWPTWRRQRATLGCRRVAGDAGVGGGGVEAGGELAAVDVPHWSTGLPPENPSHFPLV
uniref:Mediator of RNA polymerase II transcription subunit 28 n=1 Tax=Timema monikensis TaxID=170555 RepID=A0A7R9ECC5_9NEOP|nr:unnamed protein product [Timema monikensis]